MSGVINDRRSDQDKLDTQGFVVGTDRFMSGWGQAPRRSLYAVPFRSYQEAEEIEDWLNSRGDMLRVRVVGKDYRPRLEDGDHLSIRACR